MAQVLTVLAVEGAVQAGESQPGKGSHQPHTRLVWGSSHMVGKHWAIFAGPEISHMFSLNWVASGEKEANMHVRNFRKTESCLWLPQPWKGAGKIIMNMFSSRHWLFIYFVVCVPCTNTHASYSGHVQVIDQVWELVPSLCQVANGMEFRFSVVLTNTEPSSPILLYTFCFICSYFMWMNVLSAFMSVPHAGLVPRRPRWILWFWN